MATLLEVQTVIDRVFNKNILPMHYEFWRTNDSSELINAKLLDIPLFELGNSEKSNLITTLKKIKGNTDKSKNVHKETPLELYLNKNYLITDEDINILENWVIKFNSISKSKPFVDISVLNEENTAENKSADEIHIEYWREIDIFFLPNLASQQTRPHVFKMHINSLMNWIPSNLTNQSPNKWEDFLALPDVKESFEYIRLHQRRLIRQFYGDSQELLLDSLWKFGGNLLPIDPFSMAFPKHTMNGVFDWMCWIPYLDATLRAQDIDEVDFNLARAWQIGIVADGLLRTDSDRPIGNRMPINDYDSNDPNLRENVINEFKNYDAQKLLSKMISRAKEALDAGGIFPF